MSVAPLPVPARPERLAAGHDASQTLAARHATRMLRDAWRMASFSSLTAAMAREEAGVAAVPDEELRPDHDALAAVAPEGEWLLADTVAPEPPDDDILVFPRGAAAGECLHRLFELSRFTEPESWPRAALGALHDRPVEAVPELAARLPAMMVQLVDDVVHTELVPGMRLADLDPAKRLDEMGFLFPAPALDLMALRRLLVAHGYPDVALEAGMLAGFIKGFIDMIVEHDGRFWIVDWKSNHLGTTPDAYGPRALDVAMADHAYHLQALLYTVALHRYLRGRLPDYDYDTHVAGYLYLFVRGVRPGWRSGGEPAGVHARRPERALVDALDRMMEGGRA